MCTDCLYAYSEFVIFWLKIRHYGTYWDESKRPGVAERCREWGGLKIAVSGRLLEPEIQVKYYKYGSPRFVLV